MRIQFVIGCDMENTIDIYVKRTPEKREVEAIEKEIYKHIDEYEENNNGDFYDFNYYDCVCEAVKKYIPIAENPVIATIYI